MTHSLEVPAEHGRACSHLEEELSRPQGHPVCHPAQEPRSEHSWSLVEIRCAQCLRTCSQVAAHSLRLIVYLTQGHVPMVLRTDLRTLTQAGMTPVHLAENNIPWCYATLLRLSRECRPPQVCRPLTRGTPGSSSDTQDVFRSAGWFTE